MVYSRWKKLLSTKWTYIETHRSKKKFLTVQRTLVLTHRYHYVITTPHFKRVWWFWSLSPVAILHASCQFHTRIVWLGLHGDHSESFWCLLLPRLGCPLSAKSSLKPTQSKCGLQQEVSRRWRARWTHLESSFISLDVLRVSIKFKHNFLPGS